jgi:hypothetical protein
MTAPPGDSEDHHPHAPNLATRIDAIVLRRACEQAQVWRAAGFPALRMAVNLSGSNLGHPDLVAANLELELTESVAIAESVGALATTPARGHAVQEKTAATVRRWRETHRPTPQRSGRRGLATGRCEAPLSLQVTAQPSAWLPLVESAS